MRAGITTHRFLVGLPPQQVTGGVDTHLDLNVAAAVDAIGGLLGVAQFPPPAPVMANC